MKLWVSKILQFWIETRKRHSSECGKDNFVAYLYFYFFIINQHNSKWLSISLINQLKSFWRHFRSFGVIYVKRVCVLFCVVSETVNFSKVKSRTRRKQKQKLFYVTGVINKCFCYTAQGKQKLNLSFWNLDLIFL